MSINYFFEKTLGAKVKNARWSWGATNTSTNQVFFRVWADQVGFAKGVERVHLLQTDWSGKSAGYSERKDHIEALRAGANGYGVVCTAKDATIDVSRQIASFDQETLLELGDVIVDGNRIYAEVVGRVNVDDLKRHQTGFSTLLDDVGSLLRKKLDKTTKERLATARIGQGQFRESVLKLWGRQCAVTGSKITDAIRASHIKPWKDSDNDERLDPANGLPLIATLDALFDAGLITFGDNGQMQVSRRLAAEEVTRLRLKGLALLHKPTKHTSKFLAFHRDSVFRS